MNILETILICQYTVGNINCIKPTFIFLDCNVISGFNTYWQKRENKDYSYNDLSQFWEQQAKEILSIWVNWERNGYFMNIMYF